MWKYYTSDINVFWTNDSVDKPSSDYLNKINWKLEDLNVDMTNMSSVTFFIENRGVKLLKIVNDETNETLYYKFKKILKFVKNHYLVEFDIDYWLTYSIKLTEQDINVLVDRHQDFDDDKCLEFNNDINFDLNFDEIKAVKNEFTRIAYNSNWYFQKNGYIIESTQSTPLNGVYCLAINESVNTMAQAKMFLPILTYAGVCKIYKPRKFISDFLISDNFNFGDNFQLENNFYQWYDGVKDKDVRIELLLEDENLILLNPDVTSNRIEINKVDDDRFTLKLGKIYWIYRNTKNVKFKSIRFVAKEKDLYINYFHQNSFTQILTMVNKNYATKIDGLYLIPNVLNLTNLWESILIDNEHYLNLKVRLDLTNIDEPLTLIKDLKIDNNLKFNNEIPQHKLVYSYFETNYLNNQIDVSKFIDDDKLNLNYSLNFTNSFNLLTTNKYLSLDNRLISLPSKQPFPVDTYAAYVLSNMNSVNTGYEIQKQQSIINGIKGVFSGVLGGIIGSAMGGNVLGGLTGAGSVVSSISSSILSVANYEKQIKSKFADAKNTHGTNLLFGATNDTIWSNLLNDFGYYDVCVMKQLTTDSIKQLNNYFLLNGVYNPKYFKLNNLPTTTQHLGFVYAKLNSTNFNQIFSKYINEPLNIKEQILSQLCEFRIWDKIPSIE